jgi:hypothetical protein
MSKRRQKPVKQTKRVPREEALLWERRFALGMVTLLNLDHGKEKDFGYLLR